MRLAVSLLLSGSLPSDVVASVAAADPFAASLAAHYPDDPGVVVALLLNHVRLGSDDAVWMPAGNLHAYLCGVGVEVMAASDNVLRGGLTPKRVDVPELLRVLRFEVLLDPVVRPKPVAPGVVTWPAPVREFALHKATVAGSGVTLPGDGPRIVFCLRGSVVAGSLALRGGEAAFVSASEPPVAASGEGVIFQASTGLRSGRS